MVTGRSLNACQHAYHNLLMRSPISPDERPRILKRPLPLSEPLMGPSPGPERAIQPRPITFSTINGQEQTSPEYEGRPRKKRGRPNKEEHERRVAEAEARGEVYPKPRKPKTPRPSTEGLPAGATPAAGAPFSTPTTTTTTPAGPAPDTPFAAVKSPQTLALEHAARSAGQIQHEARRDHPLTEDGASQSLIAHLQQYAAGGAPSAGPGAEDPTVGPTTAGGDAMSVDRPPNAAVAPPKTDSPTEARASENDTAPDPAA